MVPISVSDARASLPELLDRVAAGEEVTITRHGRPAAVLVRPDALRARRASRVLEDAARIEEALRPGRSRSLSATVGLSEAEAEALVAEVRAGRERG